MEIRLLPSLSIKPFATRHTLHQQSGRAKSVHSSIAQTGETRAGKSLQRVHIAARRDNHLANAQDQAAVLESDTACPVRRQDRALSAAARACMDYRVARKVRWSALARILCRRTSQQCDRSFLQPRPSHVLRGSHWRPFQSLAVLSIPESAPE